MLPSERLANLLVGGVGHLCPSARRHHHHAGRAETALRAVVSGTQPAYRMHVAIGCRQTFDGGDISTNRLAAAASNVAGLHGAAVDVTAGAALGSIAADMGTGQPQVFADELDQRGGRAATSAVTDLPFTFMLTLTVMVQLHSAKVNSMRPCNAAVANFFAPQQ